MVFYFLAWVTCPLSEHLLTPEGGVLKDRFDATLLPLVVLCFQVCAVR
jgi:hypothetical protein